MKYIKKNLLTTKGLVNSKSARISLHNHFTIYYMEYNAFVKCNCYKDSNISSQPPFEEFVKEDVEGLWVDLDWENNKEKHEEFDDWKYSNPCGHNNENLF